MPRRLIRNSKLTNRQLNELVKYFALEVLANRAAKVMSINRHSAERVYQVIRRCLARECELNSPLGGEVEYDESYFGGRRKGTEVPVPSEQVSSATASSARDAGLDADEAEEHGARRPLP